MSIGLDVSALGSGLEFEAGERSTPKKSDNLRPPPEALLKRARPADR